LAVIIIHIHHHYPIGEKHNGKEWRKIRLPMSHNAYFVETKGIALDYCVCDKCGLKIKDIQDGVRFWNPNPRAIDKNICRNCYDVLQHNKRVKWEKWQTKYLEIQKMFEENKEKDS
jgi:hypothetical protein